MRALAELKALAKRPTVQWEADLEYHAQGVADAMTAIHGGRWNVAVDHETCFVLIAQEIEGWNPHS